jgi:predicted transcriptional regulator
MAGTKELDFDDPIRLLDNEGEEDLAAVDEGIRDAEAGRTVTMEEVRKLMPRWITASSSPNKR